VIKGDEDINNEQLKKLTYLDWVQLETTRLFDVANGMFFRIAKCDNYLKDVPISKGTIIRAQPTGNHYN
jgi:cytochrome P450